MEKINLLDMPADKAMAMVLERVNALAIAEVSGVHNTIVGLGVSHKNYNGKPYHYTPQIIEKLQGVLRYIGTGLMHTHCSMDALTKEESTYCYGEDIIEQMQILRQTVKLAYIFETVMGKNKRWRDNRMSRGQVHTAGKFSDDEITQINLAIRQIATFLLSIRLVAEC